MFLATYSIAFFHLDVNLPSRVLDDMKDITIITNSDQTGELSESGASVICV